MGTRLYTNILLTELTGSPVKVGAGALLYKLTVPLHFEIALTVITAIV